MLILTSSIEWKYFILHSPSKNQLFDEMRKQK